ncbi:hypothetical protein D3C78_1311880 [compost metagenome]
MPVTARPRSAVTVPPVPWNTANPGVGPMGALLAPFSVVQLLPAALQWPEPPSTTLLPAFAGASPSQKKALCAATDEQTRASATAMPLRLPQARVISETATQAPSEAFQMLRCEVFIP